MKVFGKMQGGNGICAGVLIILSGLIMLGLAQPVIDREDLFKENLLREELQRENDIFKENLFKEDLLNQLTKELVENEMKSPYFQREINRIRDEKEAKRKRTYWRQCAFNAVSCFGNGK